MRFRDESSTANWLRKRGKAKRPALSRESRSDLALCFSMIDEDDNGAIDADELRVAFAALGVDATHAQCVAEIARVDRDRSGTIQFPEFVTLVTSLGAASGRDGANSRTSGRDEAMRRLTAGSDADADARVVLAEAGVGPDGQGMERALAEARKRDKKGTRTEPEPSRDATTSSDKNVVPAVAPRSRSGNFGLYSHFARAPLPRSDDGDEHMSRTPNVGVMPFSLTALEFKRRTSIARIYDASSRVRVLARADARSAADARRAEAATKAVVAAARREGSYKPGDERVVLTRMMSSKASTTSTEPPSTSKSKSNDDDDDDDDDGTARRALLAARRDRVAAKFLRYPSNATFANDPDILSASVRLRRETRRFSMAFEDGAPVSTLDARGFPVARAAKKNGVEKRSDEKRATRRESLSATHLLESSGDDDEEQDDVITARAFPALSDARGGFFDENDPENTEKRRNFIRDASFPSLETKTRRDSEDEKALFFRGRRTETERSRRVAFSGGPSVLSRAFVDSRDRPSARAAAMRAAIARGHFGDDKSGENFAKRRWVDDGKEKEKGKPAFRSVFVGAPAGRDADAAASANDAMAPRASVDARSGGVPTRDPGARARHAVRTAAAAAGT